MATSSTALQHVNYLWDDAKAAKLSPADLLVYRSNLLGSDQRITNTGGGNTSAKIDREGPAHRRARRGAVGQGLGRRPAHQQQGQLRVALPGQAGRPAAALRRHESARAEDAKPKTTWSGCYPHCTFNLNPRASSIDTPLHSFIAAKHVDHMHPNSVISVAASRRSTELTKEIFGDEVAWTPWLRPGFELGLELERMSQRQPQVEGHRDGPARPHQLGRW